MDKRIKLLLGFIGIAIIVFCVWYFRSLVAYILIAAAISIIGHPILNLLDKIKIANRKLPKSLSAAITLIVLWFFLIAFFRIFIPLVISETNVLSSIDVYTLYHRLEQPLEKIFTFFQNTGFFEGHSTFEDYLTAKLFSVINTSYLTNIVSYLTSILGNLIIAFFAISFITFFFLKDSSLFSNGILLLFPDKRSKEVTHILESIRQLLPRYIIGIILEVLMVMLLITLGLWLIGIEFQHAVICGLVSGILNVIPYVGPWIGALFSIIIGIATNTHLNFQTELMPLIGFMVLVFAIVQTIDNVLFQPLIYSSSVNAHPLEIFLVIMMAGSLAGIGGMILAIPSYTVLRVIAKEFLSNFKIIQKITENI